eukprot:scaffold585_cov237-Pinguiococcus_pyrenoidosus.AAC.12
MSPPLHFATTFERDAEFSWEGPQSGLAPGFSRQYVYSRLQHPTRAVFEVRHGIWAGPWSWLGRNLWPSGRHGQAGRRCRGRFEPRRYWSASLTPGRGLAEQRRCRRPSQVEFLCGLCKRSGRCGGAVACGRAPDEATAGQRRLPRREVPGAPGVQPLGPPVRRRRPDGPGGVEVRDGGGKRGRGDWHVTTPDTRKRIADALAMESDAFGVSEEPPLVMVWAETPSNPLMQVRPSKSSLTGREGAS